MRIQRQQGLSLISVLIVGALVSFLLLVGFRTVPVISEYLALQRAVRMLAQEGDNGVSTLELRRIFNQRAGMDNISSVSGVDLVITREGGKTQVSVDYDSKVPVAGRVSLLFELHVSSEGA